MNDPLDLVHLEERSIDTIELQTNWAGNFTYSAERWHYPETVEQIQELVTECAHVKALGTRHSFNDIADTPQDMVSLKHCDQVLALDADASTVTVQAGIRYGQLARYLHDRGYALHNLASLPHISVAGACATGTHGSGDGNGSLATAVTALEVVAASGERLSLSRTKDADRFSACVVGLGGIGIVTQLTLAILPTFTVRQDVYEHLPMAEMEAHFEEIVSSAYSVSLFTDWQGVAFNQLWLKSLTHAEDRSPAASTRFGATLATEPRHPLIDISAVNCTEQLGAPGPWHERLPHFRMEFTPSAGEELQTEYLVPRQYAVAAIRAIFGLRAKISPLLQISEIRTVAADDLWMSPSYGRSSVALHFTWVKDWPSVQALLPQIEAALEPFDARPHWGKLFTTSSDRLEALYPKLPEFRKMVRSFDPSGKFRNAYLERFL